ncbi:hypothetical protein B0T26DRAFT_673046 [Lasiosphaeria miniovina]|uniref:Uncharacterized protein n=1 Tax=Lasiosphaeria miniovina TaxID=1954250 RepID=A0AA40B6D2_9PEZI|nr:uncharacterized protein B0T26DRAFT_673046 [Lasiosphaeria miniovina]KAK0728532.1 hypothetical protein B0T26DRAFT_673046 [Lasiosphaeria miniovina]
MAKIYVKVAQVSIEASVAHTDHLGDFVLIKYDSSRVKAPIQAVGLAKEDPDINREVFVAGVANETDGVFVEATTITGIKLPKDWTPPAAPQNRIRNVAEISNGSSIGKQGFAGVIVDEERLALGFFSSSSGAIPVSRVATPLRMVQETGCYDIRILPLDFTAIPLKDAASDVPQEEWTALIRHGATALYKVSRVACGTSSIQPGDIVLRLGELPLRDLSLLQRFEDSEPVSLNISSQNNLMLNYEYFPLRYVTPKGVQSL